MLNSSAHRSTLLLLLLSFPACTVAAGAQQSVTIPAGRKTFDVVSVRQNLALGSGRPNLTPSADGFRVTHVPLILVLMTAYTPQGGGMFLNNIENMPDWLRRDTYDIDARISDEDRAAWTDPKNQPAMLQQMLQSMLEARFKLVVHRQMKENSVYDLEIARGGVHFSETKSDEPRPSGTTLPGGGTIGRGADGVTHIYNLTMQTLAGALGEKSDRTVVDKTGLTGRYSFDLREPANGTGPSATPDAPGEDDARTSLRDMLKSVGLELKPAKEQVEFLVIDHIERPTEN